MPQTPYARALLSINGGASQTGAITCAAGDVVRCRLENTTALKSVRWELRGYPPGWATPSGWVLDAASRVIYSEELEPDDVTLPADKWGKWLIYAIVNGGGAPQLVDKTSALEILSPNGLHGSPVDEEEQFGGAAEGWAKDHEANLRTIETKLGSGGLLPPLFGTGADGAVTIGAGTTTLTRDMHYSSLAVSAGGTLVTAGFRVFCTGAVTVAATGAIHNNGSDGVGQASGGTGADGGATGTTLGGGTAGGAGGGGTGSGNDGQIAACSRYGGAGGVGGLGYQDAWTGGAGGANTTTPLTNPPDLLGLLGGYWLRRNAGTLALEHLPFDGGTGGGGGGGAAYGAGGGKGGGGGGVLVLCAQTVANSGSISATGGAGADADPGGAGGGGGGGGGGVVVVYCKSYTGTNPSAAGGLGGAKGLNTSIATGGNTNGAHGGVGRVFKLLAG